MARNLKALGLALVAVFAMSAVAASAASADKFTTDTGAPVELTAEAKSEQVFTTEGGNKVECSEVQVDEATVNSGDTSVTVKPTYNKEANTCTNEFTGASQVTTEGCHYTFHGETDANGHAKVDIVCPEGSPGIVIHNGLSCDITVAPQNGLVGVHYSNVANTTPEEDIVLNATVSGISYTATSACAFVGVFSGEAEYTGEVTVTGWEDNGEEAGHGVGRVGISVDIE